MHTAVYWRYKARYEEEFESEDEAVNFLMSGEEHGELSSEGVLLDGCLLYDHAALHLLFEKLGWEPMPPTIDGSIAPLKLAQRKQRLVS